MGFGDEFKLYTYVSDNGNSYNVKLSEEVAGEGGFAGPNFVTAFPIWPYNTSDMRHVCGASTDGHRGKLPCGTPDNSFYVGGGTFTLHGRAYNSSSAIGERRDIRHVGG